MAENGVRVGPSAPGGPNRGDGDFTNGHHDHELGIENSKTSPRLNETSQKYVQDLLAERARMENHFPLAVKLIDETLERVQLSGRLPVREQYADVYQQRTIKLSQKVHVPIKDKKFNYVGKLLGPKGNSLRRLQEETQCKIVILGRFSMKDRVREEELRNSADAKYAHLNLPLHVEVSTIAPPAEAYARIAYALAEIRRYLIPDKHDDIRQEQFRELMEDPEAAKKISMRQQNQSGGNASGSNNSGNHRNAGPYRGKYQQQTQHYYNDETVYYRSSNNAYHHPKPYVPASQRSNQIHSIMSPQAILGASPSNLIVNTTNYSGRGATSGGSAIMSNNSVSSGSATHNLRYRPSLPSYQFVKK